MLVPRCASSGGINQPCEGEGTGSEPACVAVMKPTNVGDGYYIAHCGRLNRTRIRAVVVQ